MSWGSSSTPAYGLYNNAEERAMRMVKLDGKIGDTFASDMPPRTN